jgi:hypothetical protein
MTTRYLDEASELVRDHANYHEGAPKYARYSIRWPVNSSRALFAGDSWELVEKLALALRERALLENSDASTA